MSHTPELAGWNAVVTGSSSGIGRAIALELALAGANVLIHARRNEAAALAVAEEVREHGVEAEVVLVDIAEAEGPETLIRRAWKWRGDVDVWINNAGADILTGEAAAWTFEKKLEHLWQVDVVGTLRLSRLVGARMKQRGKGAILNLGWDQAWQGMAGDSGELFATIKGAVMAFSRSLAQSLAPEVRVNCLAPGWIKTSWGEGASQYWQNRACEESLVGRWGTPTDIAQAARFLVSPAAAFINGQIVNVNGGWKRG